GTATTADLDYTPVSNRTLNFAAGVTTQTFTVTPTADNKVEANETFTFSQSGLVNGGRSVTTGTNGTGTITNDDSARFDVLVVSGILTLVDIGGTANILTVTKSASNFVVTSTVSELSLDGGLHRAKVVQVSVSGITGLSAELGLGNDKLDLSVISL